MAKKVKDDKNKKQIVEVGKEQIDKLTRSGTFEVPVTGGPEPDKRRRFFIFRQVGDSIEGTLCDPITNIRRNQSYPVRTSEGDILEIFANKIDHQIIKDNQLVGALVRIEYIGWQRIPHCSHPRKVKRWFKIQGFSEVEQHTKKAVTDKKPGPKK